MKENIFNKNNFNTNSMQEMRENSGKSIISDHT